jgi:Leu/Phe-tRNA-protein transferase
MSDTHLGIYPLSYENVTDPDYLNRVVYPNMQKNYYWSSDFSPEYYIAQAKAGFIAVTDTFEGKELLLPEIQFSYALLHFNNLHISTKVRKLMKKKALSLTISSDITAVAHKIQHYHKRCWLTPRYLQTLCATHSVRDNFQLISASIEEEDKIIAGEIGYIIGNTYTSLSGFSSKEKTYKNYGTAQLVLLAQFLQKNHFAFWNLGQSYMPYKFHLGAKQYDRNAFLKLWYENQ